MPLPVDEVVVKAEIQDECFQLGLQLQPGVVDIAKVGLVHPSGIHRLTIHDVMLAVTNQIASDRKQISNRLVYLGDASTQPKLLGTNLKLAGQIWLQGLDAPGKETRNTRLVVAAGSCHGWKRPSALFAPGTVSRVFRENVGSEVHVAWLRIADGMRLAAVGSLANGQSSTLSLILTGSSTLDPADDSLGFLFNPNPASVLFQSSFASDDTPIVSSNTPYTPWTWRSEVGSIAFVVLLSHSQIRTSFRILPRTIAASHVFHSQRRQICR